MLDLYIYVCLDTTGCRNNGQISNKVYISVLCK